MTKEELKERLKDLFGRWEKSIEQETGEKNPPFTYDGILEKNKKYCTDESKLDVVNAWLKSSKRIMFIVLEQKQNCSPNQVSKDDTRTWLSNSDNCEFKGPSLRNSDFIPNLAKMFWGLWMEDKDSIRKYDYDTCKYDDVKRVWNNEPFALVEALKSPVGRGYDSDHDSIITDLDAHLSFLKDEIDILNPNIIVCANRIVYDRVIKMYHQRKELVKKEVCVDLQSKTLILHAYHPSYTNRFRNNEEREKKRRASYDLVMENYRAFLKM